MSLGQPARPNDKIAHAEAAPLRLTGTHDTVAQFRGSPLLGAGKLTVIGLDAIADRLGARWAHRRDVVHEHAARSLQKALGPQALVQRISETEFLVAQSDLPRSAGQLRCINCLRDILRYFIGEARPADLSVHEVSRITDDGVFGTRLDVGQVEAAEAAERVAAHSEPPPQTSLDRWTPFTTSTGRRVALTCSLEPVFSLKNSISIGYRIASRVQHEPDLLPLSRSDFERLATTDFEKIDFATLARGLDRIQSTAAGRPPPSLIAPVSHITAQKRGGRATLIALLRQARELVDLGLFCEVTGVEGATTASLYETVGALRSLCLRVFGRLSDIETDDIRHLAGVGFGGLSIDCPSFGDDAEFVHWIRRLTRLSRTVSKTLLVYQIANPQRARVAMDLGVTHATLAPQPVKTLLIDDEQRSPVTNEHSHFCAAEPSPRGLKRA